MTNSRVNDKLGKIESVMQLNERSAVTPESGPEMKAEVPQSRRMKSAKVGHTRTSI